ncbi:MAG: hypothetical protein DYH17_03475 [Xanthomonadales bacterium PRO6]|nr:hypothetical protein [Xanthomonadales bacterium PRO6]
MAMRAAVRAVLAGAMLWWAGATQAQVTPDPVNLTALWYDQSQAGHGVNVVHQGSIVFIAWYVYGSDGKVLWLVAAATRQADGRYVGPLNSFTGVPFHQINNAQSNLQTNPRGEARLTLTADGKLDFGYTVDGIAQTRRLEKAAFIANPPTCTFTTASRAGASNYTDVWWRPSESGWGISIVHQGDLIFVAWYTYAGDGKPMWVTGLATRQANGSYSGELNRPVSGIPFNLIDGNATTFPVPVVGSFSLTFADGETGTFAYTLDGVAQSKDITRLVYTGPDVPKTLCSHAAGGGGGSGALSACDPGLNVGDFRVNRPDNGGGDVTERVTGPATFQGQSVLVLEQFDAQNVLTGKSYMQVTPTEIRTLGTEGYQNGVLALTTVYNPPAKFIRAPAVGESYTHSYVGNTTGQLSYTTQYSETIRREADDPEDVPAGSFNACKFKRDIQTTTFGVSASVSMDLWTAPQVGTIRSRSRTSASSGETRIDLLRARVNGVDYGQ